MPSQTFFNLPEEKREQIITATVEELFEKGFQKTSIAKIIAKAGIPRGSFYQYFEDKIDLFKFIMIDVIGKKKHHYASISISSNEDIELVELLRQRFISGIYFYREYPKLATIATEFVMSRDDKLKREILGDSEKLSHQFFVQLIDEKKRRGEISAQVNTEMLILLINSLNLSFVEYFIEKSNKNYNDNDLFNAVDNMLQIIRNGISSK